MQPQRISISRSAFYQNLNFFRRIAPHSLFLAVVKSNAYGHGLEESVEILRGKVGWFGVNSLEEAFRVRQIDLKTPLLIMGCNGLELEELKKAEPQFCGELHFVLSSRESLKLFRKCLGLRQKSRIFFHLKIDTGLSRLGLHPTQLAAFLNDMEAEPKLLDRWKGLMTHFANVEDVSDQEYAKKQMKAFQIVCQKAKAMYPKPLLCHAAASAASMLLPESQLDMIRVGISLYGLWASSKTRLSFLSQRGGQEADSLYPVLHWSSQIVHINEVKRASYIGYGCTYRAEKDMRIGVVPLGYYEGYGRELSNRSYVLVRGQRARLLGRVSMNMICIDLSLIDGLKIGDEVTLLGKNGEEVISADDLAEMANTINYEIVTRINADLPRQVIA